MIYENFFLGIATLSVAILNHYRNKEAQVKTCALTMKSKH
jgi:hypothetical protein